MSNLLLSPHDDDSCLFAAVTCMREKPLVVICTDSFIQPERGELGCSPEERAAESAQAHALLGCEVRRLGVPDNIVDEREFWVRATRFLGDSVEIDTVYAPAVQGGNLAHDMVGRMAKQLYGEKVREYTTYTRNELYTEGTQEIAPTDKELELKKQALDCYQSQIRINLPHFQAVLGKSEWLVTEQKRVHLGCGKDLRQDWINVDRSDGADVVCDLVKERLPFDDASIDRIYSQDFMEHLPPESRVAIINEIWRVLKHDAIMEHYIPNAGSRNAYGSPTHLSHWNLQCFEHFDVNSYRWEKDRHYEGFIGGFRKVTAELVNWQIEEDGIKRAQSIHVKYAAVK